MILEPLYEKNKHQKVFPPRILNESDFDGINVSDSVVSQAVVGSAFFKKRFDNETLFPKMSCEMADISMDEELIVHNYTGQCPVQTYEVNPVNGCNVGCAYCLVNDGIHEERIVVYQNYHKLLEKKLNEHRHDENFYYFSPKTEALCEATLQTGIAHNILKTFIKHFERYPDSKARIFIASKAGVEALRYKYDGDCILDLFIRLKGKMQFNTSLSIFPGDAIDYIEPYSSSLTGRLEAVKLCQENGVMANSALVQPILISVLTNELLEEFFALLSRYGIINFKPEFLTACIGNMTLMAQILEMYDKDILKKVFEEYFQRDNLDHVKQRDRTAPGRCASSYWINRMKEVAERYGISTSVCYWVREQLCISLEEIPAINRNGFKCLGYQTNLFLEDGENA